ncbi:transglycosylase SLT domain-containing protein [Schlegelella sp. ID0723]|uniref:Transglycosylase SLT domain-containing protein n=2 Tax=Piscinibacter koreensis TaxID=2742824 RepID=A0A7Y6TWC5_9BURK|nr:transglycosylase SLT domain-containing protein [Schlegelella koreensis]
MASELHAAVNVSAETIAAPRRGDAPLRIAAATEPARSGADAERIATLRRMAVDYEHGNGVARDGARAAELYCEAARLGDASSQFDLGWMYANGRGVRRDDALAAFFFRAAAAQGIEQARTMLRVTGDPQVEPPPCMREPTPPAPPPAASAPVPAASIMAPRIIANLVGKIATEHNVAQSLVLAIMRAESNFNAGAVSPKNAQGLMQLIPETASRFRVKNAFDPAQNIRGGVAYLRWLLAYFEGDVRLVAAAYNAGEGAVERYLGVPPFQETRNYVRRILDVVGPIVLPFDRSVTGPSPLMARIRERQQVR